MSESKSEAEAQRERGEILLKLGFLATGLIVVYSMALNGMNDNGRNRLLTNSLRSGCTSLTETLANDPTQAVNIPAETLDRCKAWVAEERKLKTARLKAEAEEVTQHLDTAERKGVTAQ
jgi:hypothetical protein